MSVIVVKSRSGSGIKARKSNEFSRAEELLRSGASFSEVENCLSELLGVSVKFMELFSSEKYFVFAGNGVVANVYI